MFGREHSGLTNKEVDRCHNLIHIPSNSDFSSLNLAAAVQIVAYELLKVRLNTAQNGCHNEHLADNQGELTKRATVNDMELFYTHLEQTLIGTGFIDPAAPRHVMRRLRCLFNRARPEVVEVNILRGILTAMQEKLN
jgi:tRNA (cytidine32/uridine32-2'-O)-methyltransferase